MGFIRVKSGGIWGVEGYEVDVEVDISAGIPSFNIVGLPDSAIKESKDRVRSAVRNMGFSFPQRRITVNLSPSHLRKQGTLYDLPIAVGILALSGYVDPARSADFVFLGEVSLNGKLNRVNGVLPVVASLRERGFRRFILPVENAIEGAVVEDTEIFGCEDLKEVTDLINGRTGKEPAKISPEEILRKRRSYDIDLGDVLGQRMVKKALEICAAGAHNLSLIGPPGSGKSMIVKRIVTILPPMSFQESLEVSRIYSVAGLLQNELITDRPFRSPHHTASEIRAGGDIPRPPGNPLP